VCLATPPLDPYFQVKPDADGLNYTEIWEDLKFRAHFFTNFTFSLGLFIKPLIYLWRKVVCLFCFACTYEIHQTRMLQITFLVSLESSRGGGVHQGWFHGVWTCGAKVLEYWMKSSTENSNKFQKTRFWKGKINWGRGNTWANGTGHTSFTCNVKGSLKSSLGKVSK